MSKRLVMSFSTTEGSSTSISLDEPKDGLTESEVRTVMENIINKNIFNTGKGDVAGIKTAEVITTTTETLI